MTSDLRSNSFRSHYSGSQFRVEAWNQLKHQTELLRRRSASGRDVGALRLSAERDLELLVRVERYWAFPGVAVCSELQRLCARGWYRALARSTARALRLLVGGG
jgi:hypothetical protein